MNIIDILKSDYERFPLDQTYSIYDGDVYFKDPLNEFRGLERYKKTIYFIKTRFRDVKMDLNDIQRQDNLIKTIWALNWTTPLPWRPRIRIAGRSELTLNENDKIISHIDYWDCSIIDVIKQHLK